MLRLIPSSLLREASIQGWQAIICTYVPLMSPLPVQARQLGRHKAEEHWRPIQNGIPVCPSRLQGSSNFALPILKGHCGWLCAGILFPAAVSASDSDARRGGLLEVPVS